MRREVKLQCGDHLTGIWEAAADNAADLGGLGTSLCVHVGYLISHFLSSTDTATYIINSMIFTLLAINLLLFLTILYSFDKLFV